MSSEFWVGPASAPDTYRLVSLLGGGGEGEVWEAVLPLSAEGRRSVAVKIMPAVGDAADPARWDRFGHLMRSLSHPGLVRVTDVFAGPGMHRQSERGGPDCLYVVMDYIEGTTLREWVAEHSDTTAAQRLRMLRMVASALDEMHSGATTEVPVAHGDVKPANIVVRPDGGAVLVDLGLARLTDAPGVMGRSVAYAAPELRRVGALATPEADRYAFAVTTAQALLAQPPPIGADGWLDVAALDDMLRRSPLTGRRHMLVRQIMGMIMAPPEARPRQLRPWLDGAVETLSEVTAGPAVSAATAQLPAYVGPPGPPAGPTLIGPGAGAPRRRSKLPIVAAVLALVVLLGVGAAVWLTRAGGPASSGSPTGTAAAAASTTSAAPTTTRSVTATTSSPFPSDTTRRSTDPLPPGAETYLADLRPIAGDWSHEGTLSIDGVTYPHAVVAQACGPSQPRTVEYDLGRAYSQFTTTVGMSDDTDSDALSQLEFFVDGLPKGKFTVQRGTVRKVDLPLPQALTFKIIVSTVKGARCDRGYPGATLGDPKLIS